LVATQRIDVLFTRGPRPLATITLGRPNGSVDGVDAPLLSASQCGNEMSVEAIKEGEDINVGGYHHRH
jgi:hypothetical protein